ncbi:MAG: hypothetical protein Q9159_006272 [Coniocarpon cinnabarinum]
MYSSLTYLWPGVSARVGATQSNVASSTSSAQAAASVYGIVPTTAPNAISSDVSTLPEEGQGTTGDIYGPVESGYDQSVLPFNHHRLPSINAIDKYNDSGRSINACCELVFDAYHIDSELSSNDTPIADTHYLSVTAVYNWLRA